VTWAIQLSRRERLIATRCMGLNADLVDGAEARAVIVGEAPGPKSSAACPMFPYPPHSSGGRLLSVAGMDPVEYLRRFARTDLLDVYPGPMPWTATQKAAARLRAGEIVSKADGMTVVLLGRNVVESFGEVAEGIGLFEVAQRCVPLWGTPLFKVVRLPHPSGRSSSYSDRTARARARELLRAAAAQPLPGCPRCSAGALSHDVPLVRACACGASLTYRRRGEDGAIVVSEVEV
jgi:uracil-DNA glycosylase